MTYEHPELEALAKRALEAHPTGTITDARTWTQERTVPRKVLYRHCLVMVHTPNGVNWPYTSRTIEREVTAIRVTEDDTYDKEHDEGG